MDELARRVRAAWQGRVSGCMLGKAVEVLSATTGRDALSAYFAEAGALPLRDYVPLLEAAPEMIFKGSCRGHFEASSPDDDINYSVLALELLEAHGRELTTEDLVSRTVLVARSLA